MSEKQICSGEQVTFSPFDQVALAELIRKTRKTGCRMAEIGSWLGDGSTQVFLRELESLAGSRLLCVDIWRGSAKEPMLLDISQSDDVFGTFLRNVKQAQSRTMMRPLPRASLEAAELVPDASMELIFIDASHSHEAVRADIRAWRPKVRPGGILCGHYCETRVTPASRDLVGANADLDALEVERERFRHVRPVSVRAVTEAFGDEVRLWTETPITLLDGTIGYASIWWIEIPHDELLAAIENGDDAGVVDCLARGADPNAFFSNGSSPLVRAVARSNGSLAGIRELARRGASLDQTDGTGNTALGMAIICQNRSAIELLVELGADAFDGFCRLSQGGDPRTLVQVLQILHASGFDFKTRDQSASTALIYACMSGHREMVETALAVGCEINAVNRHGETALTVALARGHKDVARLLIGHGADLRHASAALIFACLSGHREVVETVLAVGCEINAVNGHGETALTVALTRGHDDIARLLIGHGADLRHTLAYLFLHGADDQRERFLAMCPPYIGQLAGSPEAFAVLGSRDSLIHFQDEPNFVCGIYIEETSLEQSMAITSIPSFIHRVYVEYSSWHLKHLLKHISFGNLMDREIFVYRVDDAGSISLSRMEFDDEPDDFAIEMPIAAEIEPINWCNLRCRYCHVSFMKDHKIDRIDLTDLSNLASLKNAYVQVGAAFEPTLHKQFVNFVDFLSSNGCEIGLITNGTLLTDRAIASLVNADLHAVQISFDAGTKATYEAIRRQSDFDQAVANIRQLVTALRAAGKRTTVLLSVVLMKSNLHELEAMIDIAEDLGVDLLGFQFLVLRFAEDESLIAESIDTMLDEGYRRLDEAAVYAIEHNKKVTLGCPYFAHTLLRERYPDNIMNGLVIADPRRERRDFLNKYVYSQIGKHPRMDHNCVSPYTFARVNADGDVSVCRDFIIGNIRRDDLEQIWLGRTAHFVREFLIKNPLVCETCEHYKYCLQPATTDISNPEHLGNDVDSKTGLASRMREVKRDGELASAQLKSATLYKIFTAIERNDEAELAALLTPDIDLDEANSNGNTALFQAVQSGRCELADRLLAAGASAETENNFGDTPLTLALKRGDRSMAELLGRHGANADRALLFGVMNNRKDVIRGALRGGADITRAGGNGAPLLNRALASGAIGAAEALLDAGPNVNVCEENGLTPLMRAAMIAASHLVRRILDLGARTDDRDTNGTTALMHAVIAGNAQIVDLLLRSGASVSTANDHSEDALTVALRESRDTIAQLVWTAGADLAPAEAFARREKRPDILSTCRRFREAAAQISASTTPGGSRSDKPVSASGRQVESSIGAIIPGFC